MPFLDLADLSQRYHQEKVASISWLKWHKYEVAAIHTTATHLADSESHISHTQS